MTFPVFASGDVLNASDMNAVGLWLVKTQTVGTGVATVVVSSCFSADYDNYLITMNQTDGSIGDLLLYLGFSGASGSNYYYQYYAYSYAGANGSGSSNGNSSGIAIGLTGTTNESSFACVVYNPFAAQYTTATSQAVGTNFILQGGGVNRQAVSNTGFTITPSGGTLTGGTIRVYGYRN